MAEPTTTVKADLNADFTYEVDISNPTLDVLIRRGRQRESSQPRPGTCTLKMDNSAGTYTPKAGGSAIRPMHGIQVVADSQDLFTGFVTRVFLHPSGNKQDMVVSCADWLWILSRTDISLPMMLNVRSDILAARIADLVEIGELCANTRFKDDLTGYSADVGATLTRKTSGDILEGAACLETITLASTASGWGYDLFSVTSDGDVLTVRVYVIAGTPDDVGRTVRLKGNSSGGSGSSDSTLHTLTDTWEAVEVSWIAGSVSANVQVTAGAAAITTFRTGALHVTLTKSAIPRSFDTGQSHFSHIAPRRVNALRAIQEVANNELGGLVYVNGSGTLVFEDRHHRMRESASITSQGTIDEDMVDVPYEEDGDDLVGLVELSFPVWEEGIAGSTVFQLFPVPRAIPPSGTLTIPVDYGALVRDHIVPVATTDWLCNANPEGGGVDETGNVTIDYNDFGGGGQAVLTNGVARTVWLTTFKVRGTPVRRASDTPEVSYTPSGAPDYASKLKFAYRQQSSRAHVQAIAEYFGDRYVTQKERLPVKLLNKTAAILAEMTDRVISERVTITNDNAAYSSKVNGDYHIDSMQHRLSQGKTKMETIWGVVPVDDEMFGLDDADIGLDDASNYPLGP
jgi:hypothetical protein